MTRPIAHSRITTAEPRAPRRSRRWPLRACAVAYSLVWIVGLFLASSSTDVTSGGAAIVRADAPQAGAVALQFVFTEGLAALALLVVVIALGRATAIGRLRLITVIAGVCAAVISLSQTAIGLCLVFGAVRARDDAMASTLTIVINELDGAKMTLLAVLAFAVSLARLRRQLVLPVWLLPVGVVTGVALLVSAIGYLAQSNALSVAAWASLPLLLLFITACGLCVRPATQD